ncbi:MAG: Pvc16 family protein, partial [bacterium]
MSGAAVIETVSEIMVSLLEREMEKPPSGKYSITLKSPLEDIEDKDSQGVNIFLYQILENADLRNQPWI